MALIEGPYISFTLTWQAEPGIDTTFSASRSLSGEPGTYILVATAVPLLDEQAVWVDNTAPIGVPVWYLFTGDQTGEQLEAGPFTLPEEGRGWLKDPFRPWADVPLDLCTVSVPGASCDHGEPAYVWVGLSDETWEMDAGLFPVLNSERPADVWARRKFERGTFQVATRTLEARDAMYELLTAGGPLQLQLPQIYGWADAFVQPGDVSVDRIARDQRRPERLFTVPFEIVDQPFGPVQGIDCANWCEIEAAFPTYAALASIPGTYLDLLEGDVLCPDVPPEEDGFGIGPFGDGPFGDGG